MDLWNKATEYLKTVYNAATTKESIENSEQYRIKLKAIKELKRIAIEKHFKALRQELKEIDALEQAAKSLYNQQCNVELTKEKARRLFANFQ